MNEMEMRGVGVRTSGVTSRTRRFPCWKWVVASEMPSSLCAPNILICVSMAAILPSRRLILFRWSNCLSLIQTHESYDPNRMRVWQADLVKDETTPFVPEGGCDLLLIMFVLSAVNPQNMDLFMQHAVDVRNRLY